MYNDDINEKLDMDIDNLELDEMDEFEIERVVSSLSKEGMNFRKVRKDVRYKLYRLYTEALGGPSSEADAEFIAKFEKDPLFGGWKFFGITWDVAIDDPYRCVHRNKSGVEEWDELVKAKFPILEPGGRVSYPDITVRRKIEKHHQKKM